VRKRLLQAQLHLIKELSQAANRGVGADEILKMAVKGAAGIFGFAACDVFLLEDDGALSYRALAIDSRIKDAVERLTGLTIIGYRVPLFKGSCFTEVLESKRPVVLTDMVRVFEDFTDSKAMRKLAPAVAALTGFDMAVRVPLISSDRAIGVLGAATKGRRISRDEIKALELFSSHLALIVERTKAEEALRESEEKYRSLVESSHTGIYVVQDGVFRLVNRKLCELSGYTEKELLGMDFRRLVAPQSQHLFEELQKKCMRTATRIEFKGLRKDGETRDVLALSVPITYQGRAAVQGNVIDLTEMKRTERRLQKAYEELQKAYEDLKSLERMKRNFLASISHELRSPLNSIVGFTALLMRKSDSLSAEQRKQLKIVHSNARHLLGLIEDLLDLSKMEAGMIDLSPESFSIKEAVEEVVGSFVMMIEEKGLELEQRIDEVEVYADRRRFKQVVFNLLGNAVKFTDRGAIRIRAERDGAMVKVSVEDTGIGIKEEDMKMLFQPFQHRSMKEKARGGSGLGLYFSKRIAELMGGELKATSTYGSGSTFTFLMPIFCSDKR